MKTLVIKVGGEFLAAEEKALELFQALKQLQFQYHVVLVHGGGPVVEQFYQQMQLKTQKINGLRVTPDAEMPIVCGALAGTANKKLVSLAIKAGTWPVGISLADGLITRANAISDELGAVGVAQSHQPDLLHALLNQQFLPIISSIGADSEGRLLNINADDAATAIAKMLNGELMLLSNVPGVLDKEQKLIPQLNADKINALIAEGVIKNGMQVKVNAALDAAKSIGQAVTIASWKQPQSLLNLLTSKPFGTQIRPNQEHYAHRRIDL